MNVVYASIESDPPPNITTIPGVEQLGCVVVFLCNFWRSTIFFVVCFYIQAMLNVTAPFGDTDVAILA